MRNPLEVWRLQRLKLFHTPLFVTNSVLMEIKWLLREWKFSRQRAQDSKRELLGWNPLEVDTYVTELKYVRFFTPQFLKIITQNISIKYNLGGLSVTKVIKYNYIQLYYALHDKCPSQGVFFLLVYIYTKVLCYETRMYFSVEQNSCKYFVYP